MISRATRLWLAAGRASDLAHRALGAVRDEWMLCCVPVAGRDAVTASIYSRATEYMPAGSHFEQGLFAWEKDLLLRAEFPRRGRILLPGAGAGREAKVLMEMGYAVSAFEPAEALHARLRDLMASRPDCHAGQAAYADLVAAAGGAGGPLANWLGPYDLVWLGWGSFTHVTHPDLQVEVLKSIRRLAPDAPVLLSYYLREPDPLRAGGVRRLRRAARRTFARLGGSAPMPGVEFWDNVGFTYAYTEEELRGLFQGAGYSVAVQCREPYPHALILPRREA